jgi:1-acyl-sn-glycerol-3-phosphate acyltransferase
MLYYFATALCRIFFRLTGGLETIGQDNIPETGGVILCPNHVSHVDPPAVGSGTRRHVHFMAKDELFKVPVLGRLIAGVGSFPVRRGKADRKALKRAIDLLEEGRVVCLFPEGTRSPDGKLQDPERGVSLIALKTGAPVVPVAIIGTTGVLPAGASRPRRNHCKIVFGKPIRFDDLSGSTDRSSMAEVGRRIMSAIADLQSSHR